MQEKSTHNNLELSRGRNERIGEKYKREIWSKRTIKLPAKAIILLFEKEETTRIKEEKDNNPRSFTVKFSSTNCPMEMDKCVFSKAGMEYKGFMYPDNL